MGDQPRVGHRQGADRTGRLPPQRGAGSDAPSAENVVVERHLLFVDDQWCRPEDQHTIRAAFGDLQRRDPPYRFHYETAEIAPGDYGAGPVFRRIASLPPLSAVILDI